MCLKANIAEARLDKVSNAIQEAIVGCRHGGCELHAPAVGGRPQHPLRDVRRLSGLPHKKPQYMKRRSEFPTPQGREIGAYESIETMALKGKPRDMNKW